MTVLGFDDVVTGLALELEVAGTPNWRQVMVFIFVPFSDEVCRTGG